jgi:hypothetical protein
VFPLAHDGVKAHTPGMNLKSASLLAFLGTVLVTILLAWNLFNSVLNVARGLTPAAVLFSSLLYAFGALTVAVFFFAFHRSQS